MRSGKTFVAGHQGMVGSAIIRALKAKGYSSILTVDRRDLDLLDQRAVAAFFKEHRPEYVILAAGRIGGIHANRAYRADFLYENLVIEANVIHQAFIHDTQKLLFFACNCIYPKSCQQPIREEDLLTGPLEATSESFALAKIAGLKLCESYNRQYGTDFITLIPTNLYGPNQKIDLMTSMVVPSLIQRFHQAKIEGVPEVVVWGTGSPRRDFLYVDDLAKASLFVMENYQGNLVLNVATGKDHSIIEVSETIRNIVGYQGVIRFDPSLPDGTLYKTLDGHKLKDLGWSHEVDLETGIKITYQDFLQRFERRICG